MSSKLGCDEVNNETMNWNLAFTRMGDSDDIRNEKEAANNTASTF